MEDQNYIAKNKATWNERTKIHIDSEFYNQKGFLEGETSLKEIELALLGNINGKSVLHLQCHFGQDSISLARMGAQVTGVDFSDEAIQIAKETAQKLALDTQFICCDIFELPNYLNQKFDIVFTTYGTIGWLPDMNKWSAIVSQFLKPGGEFIFVEFHPFIWMMDNDLKEIKYNYFKDEAIIEMEGTYTDHAEHLQLETIGWNHSIGEVMQNLLDKNLQLISFQEFDYSPYNVFPNSIEVGPSRYQIQHYGNKIPMVYAMKMKKLNDMAL